MTQYINKSALVAEIEKEKKEYAIAFSNMAFKSHEEWLIEKGKYRKLLDILSFLDTLEAKEDGVHGTVDYPLIGCDFPNIYPNYKELKEYCDRKSIKDNDKVKLIIIKDM